MKNNNFKGYFTRKPADLEEVKYFHREARRDNEEPDTIEKIGEVILTKAEYRDFCKNLVCKDYDFLKPFTEESYFTETTARCVMVGAPGEHLLAVCLEGYTYGRYVAWPFGSREVRVPEDKVTA